MKSAERHALALAVLDLDRQIDALEARRRDLRGELLASMSRLADQRESWPDGLSVTVVRTSRATLDRGRLAVHLGLTPEGLDQIWQESSISKPIAPYVTIRRR